MQKIFGTLSAISVAVAGLGLAPVGMGVTSAHADERGGGNSYRDCIAAAIDYSQSHYNSINIARFMPDAAEACQMIGSGKTPDGVNTDVWGFVSVYCLDGTRCVDRNWIKQPGY